MKKLSKRVLSLVLSLVILASLCTVVLTANAADGGMVYFKNTANWSTVNAYYWPKNGSGPVAWPGSAMTSEGDGVFSINVPAGNDMIIFNNGGTQTDDLDIPGANYIYDYSTGAWSEYIVGPKAPSFDVSKKDGTSFKTDTVDVTITVKDADSASYSIDGGASNSFVGSTTVTIGAGVAVNSTTTLTVTATNDVGTTTETFTYTKKEAASNNGDDGSTAPALDGYFSTNPDNQVGKQASITIDGSISDWDSSMLIAQGVANDDPRVYRDNSMYEIGMDDYALYAAWDNTNLYLMWEMANVQDAVAPSDTYPISQGNHWINNMPFFIYFSTDPSIQGDGTVSTGGTVWGSGITFDAYVDTVLAFSTNGANGPFIHKANDDGKIVYNETRHSSIKMMWGNETISTELWGIDEGYGTWNNRIPGDVLDESSAWIDFYQDPDHSKAIDMFYEISIPLELLGITASDLTSQGIGVMKVSTFGTSGMNSLPADPSMWDNAALPYSEQEPNSHEKEDEDHFTVPLARIGKMLSSSPVQPTTPVETQPQTQPQTEPSSSAGTSYVIGDADGNGDVNIMDATTIQLYLAHQLDTINVDAANVDKDANVTIMDATHIQLYLAKQGKPEYNIGSTVTK